MAEYAVSYGNFSGGKDTFRLAVRIPREAMSLDDVDSTFCGRRVEIEVRNQKKDGPPALPGMEDVDIVIGSVCDVKQVGLRPDVYSFGLMFNATSTDIKQLASMRQRGGVLNVISSAAIPDDEDEGADDHEDVGPVVRQKPGNGDPGRVTDIYALIPYGMTKDKCERVKNQFDIVTIAQFEQVINTDEWWHRKVKGIGLKNVDVVIDALVAWRRDYPVPSQEDEQEESDSFAASEELDDGDETEGD